MSRICCLMLFLGIFSSLLHSEMRKELDLQECLDYARANSRSLKVSLLNYEKVLLNVEVIRAALDPTLTSSVKNDFENDTHSGSLSLNKEFYGGWNLSTSLGASGADPGQDDVSTSLSLSKELLEGASVMEDRKALDDQLVNKIKEANRMKKNTRSVLFQIKKSFFRVLRNMETLTIQERRLKRSEKNLEHALEREEPMDIATAKLEVPSSELSVLSSKMTIQAALDDLKEVMGMPLRDALTLSKEFDFSFTEINFESDLKSCLESHEDLLNARLDLVVNKRHLVIAQRKTLPRVWLTAALSQDSQDGLRGLSRDSESLGLNLSWPIMERASAGQRDVLKQELKILEIDLVGAEQQKIKIMRSLFRILEEQRLSISLQESQLVLKERQVELYKDRWNEGEIDILEVVRNENDLENSRVNLVNRRIQYLETLEEYFFERG
jgi:outer membrane protein TolC